MKIPYRNKAKLSTLIQNFDHYYLLSDNFYEQKSTLRNINVEAQNKSKLTNRCINVIIRLRLSSYFYYWIYYGLKANNLV